MHQLHELQWRRRQRRGGEGEVGGEEEGRIGQRGGGKEGRERGRSEKGGMEGGRSVEEVRQWR